MILTALFWGIILWIILRFLLPGFYVVQQNERAVKTVFGRAQRLGKTSTLDDPEFLILLTKMSEKDIIFHSLKL
jgi:regulator of protease activity HflC (stomatin/prohibitin superfamily)